MIHTDPMVMKDMLRVVLEEGCGRVEGTLWEPEDYLHEDLVLQEYTKARINSYTQITVDWNSNHRSSADYFMYYSKSKINMPDCDSELTEPIQPSQEELESMDSPPSDFIKEMKDFYYHHYVGKV